MLITNLYLAVVRVALLYKRHAAPFTNVDQRMEKQFNP